MTSEQKIVRQNPGSRVEAALAMLPGLDRPRLYKDRNGRGSWYARLRYIDRDATGRSRTKSYYLGQPTDVEMAKLELAISQIHATRDQERVIETSERSLVSMLVGRRRNALRLARELAARCGYHFVGYRLRKGWAS